MTGWRDRPTNAEKARRAAVHPGRPGQQCTAPAGYWGPVIDRSRCEGKSDCVAVCPYDVFEIRAIEDHECRVMPTGIRLKLWFHKARRRRIPPEPTRAVPAGSALSRVPRTQYNSWRGNKEVVCPSHRS